MASTINFQTDARGVATIRLLVLRAAGKSFSAGADIDWMRRNWMGK